MFRNWGLEAPCCRDSVMESSRIHVQLSRVRVPWKSTSLHWSLRWRVMSFRGCKYDYQYQCGARHSIGLFSATMTPLLRLSRDRRPVRIGRTIPLAVRHLPRAHSRSTRAMSSSSDANGGGPKQRQRAQPAVPRPSATVIVVNARNEILLVHRNPKSTSFANAHVSLSFVARIQECCN